MPPLEGIALLVGAHGTGAAELHALGRVGEALLGSGERWRIRRLAAGPGERYRADRSTLKQHVHELAREAARVAMVVAIGAIADLAGEPALVTGSNHRAYPEDTTLPLPWLRARLAEARADKLVVVLAGRAVDRPAAPDDAARWLAALAPESAARLVVVEAADGAPLIDALHAGLRGDALDSRTGTVTARSLTAHLARARPTAALLGWAEDRTLAEAAPRSGLWDPRRGQLALPATGGGAPDDLTGTVLPGRFRLDALVARGTFGAIYRARQLAVERDVAVKVLHAGIDPASEDGRLFVQEIQSVGRLDHANVVRIYQADTTREGRLFFAMELLPGRDLQAIASAGPLPQARAVALVRQLLAGLGAAHAAGLVHADVKPANALVVERAGEERVVLVDFGLARLRAGESAGGTPAYMAPEQLREGRVDARSDLFSAALVLVTLLTGWRRPDAKTLVPPLEDIADARLRGVLSRALALDPAARPATAGELAAALADEVTAVEPAAPPAPRPFRLFAAYTEADRGRLHGRDADLDTLVEHVLYGRALAYTAPSGTGKTSILRAGLGPRLESLGGRAIYLRCRGEGDGAALRALLAEDAGDLAAALAAPRAGKLVIVLDQVEAALPEVAVAREVLAAASADADVAVVLGVREDALARVIAAVQDLEPALPIVRLPPLPLEGARAAIVAPLAEARLAIEPALLDALLADLRAAGAALAPEMGWGSAPAVYPPHLQLAGSVLYDALAPGEVTLTLARYRALGGFDAIVGEHLERVLDVELSGARAQIARDLLVALVTTTAERAMRPEGELVEIVAAGVAHPPRAEILGVLDVLRARGLLVRTGARGGEPGWELAHDSLVPRVQAWLDRRDLARRRAVELVRYHLRRSRPAEPSLLGRRELRELRAHAGAVAELDAEWARRPGEAWTPSRLVAHSARVLRRRAAVLGGGLLLAVAVAGASLYSSRAAAAREAAEQRLRELDLGRVVIQLEAFDWDSAGHRPVLATPRALRWELHAPDPDDPDQPGPPYDPAFVLRGAHDLDGDHVEARGGRAYLVVDGRGAPGESCAPSILPLARLPGYMGRATETVLRLGVPTCAATRADTIAIPAGPFLYGGIGEPPSEDMRHDPEAGVERVAHLGAFRIDRTEVTNAAFAVFAQLSAVTGIDAPEYPDSPDFVHAAEPLHPVSAPLWTEARAYCRYLGKDLPSSEEWTRALRGGETLPDGSPNPAPRRNLPWGAAARPGAAKVLGVGASGTADVSEFPEDRSPEGVLGLAGNVTEWTRTPARHSTKFVIVRGANCLESDEKALVDFVAIENQRPRLSRHFAVGLRCVEPVR